MKDILKIELKKDLIYCSDFQSKIDCYLKEVFKIKNTIYREDYSYDEFIFLEENKAKKFLKKLIKHYENIKKNEDCRYSEVEINKINEKYFEVVLKYENGDNLYLEYEIVTDYLVINI